MTKRISMLWGLCVVFAFQASAPAQTITNQPQSSLTINNASTATFTVGASGATSYQWKLNGGNLSDTGTNQSVPGSISGSTNSTLILENVTSNQAGTYTVLINGTLTSSNAVLTIIPGTIVTFALSGLLPGAPGSNLTVELFDHDKPATVANFLHYIRSGAFSNMFFDFCSPGLSLNGGFYGTSNRTDVNQPVYGWDIRSKFTATTNETFPYQVASEYNSGPLIKNDFGTMTMVLERTDFGFGSAWTNSAQGGFVFNLGDNSSNLNILGRSYTVFGRVISNTNLLNYFNGLTSENGIAAGEFSDGETNNSLGSVPVNYSGTNAPANANLVYCDFNVTTNVPVDTTPPMVVITSPAPSAVLTNGPIVQGEAVDNVAVAVVSCVLTPQETNGIYANGGFSVTNYAVGTSNWSLTFSDYDNNYPTFYSDYEVGTVDYLDEAGFILPGTYTLTAQSQDGAGNLSTSVSEQLTVTAITTSGIGTVSFTNNANNPIGYPFQEGSNYVVQAVAGSNQVFVSWSATNNSTGASGTSFYPELSFEMADGLLLTATFISNDIPNSIAFTSPTTNAVLTGAPFTITGTISNGLTTPPVTVTCTVFSTNTGFAVTPSFTTSNNTTTWSVFVTNYLATGNYLIQAIAVDSLGASTLITENFSANSVPPPPLITSPASGAVLTEGGPLLLQGTATAPLGVAKVLCYLVPVTNADGTAPYEISAYATGSNNWSLELTNLGFIPPGNYTLAVETQDSAGNLSIPTEQPLTITGIVIDGNGSVTLTQNSSVKNSPIGYPLQTNLEYKVTATPSAGQTFLSWTYGDFITASPTLNFGYSGGVLTATFIPTNTPRGTKGIAITYPSANAKLMTNSFIMKGTITASFKPAQITCQISSLTTGIEAGLTLTTTGTRTWSVAVSNLPPDEYLVEAVATNSEFSTVIYEAFYVLDFKGVEGTYSGLFICSNAPVTPTNSGLFTFTVGASGAFSGRLLFPAYTPLSLNNHFDADGHLIFGIENLPGNPVDVNVNLDLTNGTDALTGYIYSTNANSWISPLVCYRGVSKLTSQTIPAVGKYIFALPFGSQTNNPATNGYASLAVASSGALSLSGALPDGAAFSESARVSKAGVWPLYVIPTGYGKGGMLMGWEAWQTNGAGSYAGQLYWYKNGGIGAYYTGGVDTNVNSTGTNYVRPATGTYSIVFEGGTISPPLTNTVTVNSGGQFVVPRPAPADKLAISISTYGVITGHFVPLNTTKSVQFKGAFFGQSQGGSGLILDSGNLTGHFLLEQQ